MAETFNSSKKKWDENTMKIHLLENFDETHKPASIGEELIIGKRKMKVTEIQNVDEHINRLTLED